MTPKSIKTHSSVLQDFDGSWDSTQMAHELDMGLGVPILSKSKEFAIALLHSDGFWHI